MPTPKKLIGTIVAVAIVVPLTTTIAQDHIGDISDDSWVGVVTTGPAVVRCGANESYYPIATARDGDFVRVLGKRQDWLSVELVGRVFKDTVGYIKYPEENTSLFTVAGELNQQFYLWWENQRCCDLARFRLKRLNRLLVLFG